MVVYAWKGKEVVGEGAEVVAGGRVAALAFTSTEPSTSFRNILTLPPYLASHQKKAPDNIAVQRKGPIIFQLNRVRFPLRVATDTMPASFLFDYSRYGHRLPWSTFTAAILLWISTTAWIEVKSHSAKTAEILVLRQSGPLRAGRLQHQQIRSFSAFFHATASFYLSGLR